MTQAIGDPDELDHFAHSLAVFLETVTSATSSLEQSFSTLGETWRDHKRAEFEEEFSALIQQVSVFESNAQDHIPHIQQLASRLREYLQS